MIHRYSFLYSKESRDLVAGLPAVPRKLIAILWDWQAPYAHAYYVRYHSATVRNVLHTAGGECFVKVMSSSPERALEVAKYHYCLGSDFSLITLDDVPPELRTPLKEMQSNSDYR